MWSALGRRFGLYGPPAPGTEPIASIENAGIPSPPPEARHPVKIEPGLNDFAYPQELLDADIPDRSQRGQRTQLTTSSIITNTIPTSICTATLAISTRQRSSKLSMRRTCGNFT